MITTRIYNIPGRSDSYMMAGQEVNGGIAAVGTDPARSVNIRNLISFWLFGLCNNYGYSVMLSAAHDIMGQHNPPGGGGGSNSTNMTTPSPSTGGNTSHLVPHCNLMSTGAILLADIIPTLVIKLTAPFFVERIPYIVRVWIIITFVTVSFPMVAVSHLFWLQILGVVCASISAGLGEITFLSLSSHFDKNTVSTWSSGTGASGVISALSYAGITSLGVSPSDTLLIMLVVPVIFAASYCCLLVKPASMSTPKSGAHRPLLDQSDEDTGEEDDTDPPANQSKSGTFSFKEKLMLIQPLLPYMIPLMLVYFAEYFINQGLHELVIFKGAGMEFSEQYRWYQVTYQVGVFISRSSVNLFTINKLWILPILQFVNVALFLVQIFFKVFPSIWIIFAVILWEGLLGGAAYVNTFYKITIQVPKDRLEFSMAVASVADSSGILMAALIAIPVHNTICSL